ncbi:MAG: family hydrolase [Ilumatobacteraceae bacterium]|jgi:phosphoglycolate phosphatase|nr:family hydrolase [Ilumatobacteraceae bacterium]
MTTAPTAVLWDIDGTLLRARGTGVSAFVQALATVTGQQFPTGDLDMGGRTDPEMARRILQFAQAEGDHDEMADRMLVELAAIYRANEMEYAERTSALPGVIEALVAFDELDIVQTVVTGNIEPIARMKIAAAELDQHLRLDVGGYGSDHHVRSELVHTASRRIAAAIGPVDPARTWVVGDTPRDLQCARAAGVRCVLVATGTNTIDKLDGLGADAVFGDLSDLDRLIEIVGA